MTKKDEAIAALKAANPKWSDKHIAYCYELMPKSVSYAYEKGSSDREKEHKYWMRRWTLWAIEMNLLPDGTVIPEAPEALPPARVVSKRDNTAPVATQHGITEPKPGTNAKAIWDLSTELSAQHGRQVTPEEMIVAGGTKGWNIGNVKTEFSRWRKFNSQK